MREENLSDLLERAADAHAVGSPPLDHMFARTRRARKRRAAFMVLAASVVVGGLIVGTTWLFNPSDSPGPADSPPNGDVNIDGTWTVTSLTNANGISMVSGRNAPIIVTFTQGNGGLQQGPIMQGVGFPNGSVTIDSRQCHFSANYLQSAGAVRGLRFSSDIGWAVTSSTACIPEKVLYGVLPSVRHVSESGDVLYLHSENWTILATLGRVSSDPVNQDLAFATYKSTGASDQALGSGILTVSNGCLVLGSGAHTHLLVLDDRTTWDGATLHVVDAFGHTADMQLGDKVTFGGGYGSVPLRGAASSRFGVTVPDACFETAQQDAFFAGTLQ